jgi:hypothetical protein
VSRDEIIAAIQKCAEELGHVPSMDELVRIIGISKYMVRRDFGPYVNALAACGLERHGCGYKIDMHKLFLDWAAVTRKLGKTPSMLDYEMHGKYTTKALVRHYGGWTHVPAGLLGYAREAQLENEWQDVMEIAEAALKVAQPPARTLVKRNLAPGRRVAANQPVYGPPMMTASPLVYAPTNEAGVMVLFGAVARKMDLPLRGCNRLSRTAKRCAKLSPKNGSQRRLNLNTKAEIF